MNIISQLNYIIALKAKLDSIDELSLKEAEIKRAIIHFRDIGYSDEEILKIFKFEKITEAEDHSEMIKSHQEYIEIVSKLLGKGNNE